MAVPGSRRRFIQSTLGLTGFGALSACLPGPMSRWGGAPSAEPARPSRIGVLHLSPESDPPVVIGLRQGLAELGYVEVRDAIIEIRSGRGRPEAATAAARELVEARIQILVAAGTVATQAARDVAGAIPIVFTQVGDPVAAGFVQSVAHPGGRLTGFSHLLPASTGKRLELLRDMIPTARTVVTFYDPENPSSAAAAEVARTSARKLGLELQERHVHTREAVSAAVREVGRGSADAIVMLPDSLVVNAGDEIIEMAAAARLPVMFHEDTWVRRGGLASYGPSFTDLARQAATYVDKILKGALPTDLPVQQAVTFDLVVNLKTAQALGLTVPPPVLAQASEVIQLAARSCRQRAHTGRGTPFGPRGRTVRRYDPAQDRADDDRLEMSS